MKKSKELIVKRYTHSLNMSLSGLNGVCLRSFCYQSFRRFFGITLAPGEKKHVEITIEEIK